MVYKIEISETAKQTYYSNIEYLEVFWDDNVIKRFITKTSQVVDILKQNPKTFPVWKHNNKIYKVPIVKQVTLFYQIEKSTIQILLFWNTYQDPNTLLKVLS